MQTFTRFTAIEQSRNGPEALDVWIDYTTIVSVEEITDACSRVTLTNGKTFILAVSPRHVFAAMIEADRDLGVDPFGRCKMQAAA